MRDSPLAHSARRARGIPPQFYGDHIYEVCRLAGRNAAAAVSYRPAGVAGLQACVEWAGFHHDLGKLEPDNQAVLATRERGGLAVNHVDAGVAQLCLEGRWEAALGVSIPANILPHRALTLCGRTC
jgi:hypothetical protein